MVEADSPVSLKVIVFAGRVATSKYGPDVPSLRSTLNPLSLLELSLQDTFTSDGEDDLAVKLVGFFTLGGAVQKARAGVETRTETKMKAEQAY